MGTSTGIEQIAVQNKHTKLQDGWRVVRFGDVVRNVDVSERDPLAKGIERYIGLDHLDPESLHIKRWGLIEEGTSFSRKFVTGQVLFGKRRAYQRKAAIAEFDGICSGDILVFEAKDDLLPELLPFIVQSNGFFEHALDTSAGSLSPRTKWKDLAVYEFPLPPKDEQRRIADILWSAEKEKRALLCAVDSLERLIRIVGIDLFEQNCVRRVSLGEYVSKGLLEFQTGPFGTVLKASSYVTKGTPIINPVNMLEGKLTTGDGPFLSDEDCKRLSRYRMLKGDLILGRKGEMGKIIYVSEEYEGYIMGSDCIRIRLNSNEIESKFLYLFLISPQTRTWLTRHASGTTMPGINEKILANLEVGVPDITTQNKVIQIFQSLYDTVEFFQIKLDKNSSLSRMLINRLLSRENNFLKLLSF